MAAKEKFLGTYQELQDKVLLTTINGEWKELPNGPKQYRSDTGAILNWWETSKTITFQGHKEAANVLRQKFYDTPEIEGQSSVPKIVNNKDSLNIFVVHGHDTSALEQLELILRRLGLDPYILQNNDGQSRTLIEALEQQIYDDSAFGIVLMTPDDYGYRKDQEETDRQPRARQNVILEMGMVMASLGRERMVILKKGNLDMPSDVNGVIYLEFNDHVKEITGKLAQRIKTAGIDIEEEKITAAMN